MRLQKQLSRKVGDKEYAKWVIVIPPEKIKEAELREGQELDVVVKNRIITLKAKGKI
jgi:hypothetical protein